LGPDRSSPGCYAVSRQTSTFLARASATGGSTARLIRNRALIIQRFVVRAESRHLCFNRRFSSSNSLSRRASLTSMPPALLVHLWIVVRAVSSAFVKRLIPGEVKRQPIYRTTKATGTYC
jgi:hypothetical protein